MSNDIITSSDAANLTSNLSIYLGLYAPSKGKCKA